LAAGERTRSVFLLSNPESAQDRPRIGVETGMGLDAAGRAGGVVAAVLGLSAIAGGGIGEFLALLAHWGLCP
jgi:hypothetical protein